MKKFTKLFLALAMIFVAANASAALKEYEVDTRYTTIKDLEGKAFYIVNETDGKALYGTNNQNLGYDVYGAATNTSNSGYTWKIEASAVDGCYRFRLQTPAGEPYSIWGAPGYLNTNGSNAFVLGLQGTAPSPREGQDIENGAAWIVGVQGDGTFTLESKGAEGKYLKDNNGTSTTATKFTFCTLKEKESTDPLATEKGELQDAIDLGKLKNAFAKTAASFAVLTSAITAGEAEVVKNSPETDAEKLGACKQAILDAIDGLVLENGYTNLTTDMYYSWNSNTKPTEKSSTGCDYVLNVSTGGVYGDCANVGYLNFADISDFDKLYVLINAGEARVQMNRETDGGTTHVAYRSAAVSEVNFATEKAKDGVLEGFDYVHLNAIKDNWGGLTVNGMLLYREITVTSAGYATFGSLYKNAKPNSVTAYAAKYNSSTKEVVLTEVENVPAGKGVIIEGSAGSYAPTFDVEASAIDSDLEVSNGTVTGDGSTIFVLGNGESGIGFYKLKEGNVLEAGKAYLKIPGGISSARGIRMVYKNSITDVNEVKAQKQGAKGVYYNLSGQRVSHPTKGLYIVDGKVVSFN